MVPEYQNASKDEKLNLIYKMRKVTCRGLMDCKKALTNCDSLEGAKRYLIRQGDYCLHRVDDKNYSASTKTMTDEEFNKALHETLGDFDIFT